MSFKEKYYELPLSFERLIKKENVIGECDLIRSICNNIALIITSKFNEHRYNPGYGCEVWDSDFELIVDVNRWKEKVRKSIAETIELHEKRIVGVNVDAELNEEEMRIKKKNIISIKKRLEIKIESRLRKTGEPFHFKMKLFISPLSLD